MSKFSRNGAGEVLRRAPQALSPELLHGRRRNDRPSSISASEEWPLSLSALRVARCERGLETGQADFRILAAMARDDDATDCELNGIQPRRGASTFSAIVSKEGGWLVGLAT